MKINRKNKNKRATQLLSLSPSLSALALLTLLISSISLFAQPSYIPEQLGRDEHHIIQSLGAFVGYDEAEHQAFDITFMPGANNVEGVMIINTADYRCTFKMDSHSGRCFYIQVDVRSLSFQREFSMLFNAYPTEKVDTGVRQVNFGNKVLIITETESKTTQYKSYTIVEV